MLCAAASTAALLPRTALEQASASRLWRTARRAASLSKQDSVRRTDSLSWAVRRCSPQRYVQLARLSCQAAGNGSRLAEDSGDEEEILTKEEDWTVPGGYKDSLTKNTPLGRAVSDACSELEQLGAMEAETLQKANDLIAKLGYKIVQEQQPHSEEDIAT